MTYTERGDGDERIMSIHSINYFLYIFNRDSRIKNNHNVVPLQTNKQTYKRESATDIHSRNKTPIQTSAGGYGTIVPPRTVTVSSSYIYRRRRRRQQFWKNEKECFGVFNICNKLLLKESSTLLGRSRSICLYVSFLARFFYYFAFLLYTLGCRTL